MKPIQIDVFFPVPEGWGMCNTCEALLAQANLAQAPHERGLDEYPPEWQEDFKRLSSIIIDLAGRYQDKVMIRIWDPRSLQGMLRSIRHGIRRYPTYIVNGKSKYTGWDIHQLDQEIQTFAEITESNL